MTSKCWFSFVNWCQARFWEFIGLNFYIFWESNSYFILFLKKYPFFYLILPSWSKLDPFLIVMIIFIFLPVLGSFSFSGFWFSGGKVPKEMFVITASELDWRVSATLTAVEMADPKAWISTVSKFFKKILLKKLKYDTLFFMLIWSLLSLGVKSFWSFLTGSTIFF